MNENVQLIAKAFPINGFNTKNVGLVIGVALAYIISARISQIFAIAPGNITPVWIPSGIMLGLAMTLGTRVWPGVFLGAFLGNVWAYFSADSVSSILRSLASGSINGIGDVLSIVFMAMIIQHLSHHQSPFVSLRNFLFFGLFGAIVGPFISAIFGITGLWVFGFLPSERFLFALTNWWIGDGVGVLVIAPLVLSLMSKEVTQSRFFVPALTFSLAVFISFTAALFNVFEPGAMTFKLLVLAVPIAFIVMLYEGKRAVFVVQVTVSAIAVYATYNGLGPFVSYEDMTPLMSLQLFIGLFACVLLSVALVVNQKQIMTRELAEHKARLENLYRHDALTGQWNRYRVEEFLELELKRYRRHKDSFAVYMIDIDDFKLINDSRGHLEGDRILVELGELINREIRESDLLGRWGGEEFIIVASEPTINDAETFAVKLVKLVEGHDFKLENPLSISVGLTLSKPDDTNTSIIQRADMALYQAKASGKNQFKVQL